ncbi:hypothetical protein HPB48_015479 [Haemaphysalis longicornis]|uniref:APCDD1 domain-containing protein n=1 Tax=Haemaphysalis longicornis TaxID=44386 RepID=A0A9J6FIG2_HAELO|nr:hypothetical protein HPB48_015479 [Haemaphysalis longicornis]
MEIPLPCGKASAAGCHVCHLVAKGAELSPPQLPPKPKLAVHLNGEWLSLRCEVQPLGLFLARRLLFEPGANGSWSGWFQYFRDPNCKQRWFLLSRRGTYELAGPSQRLRGATRLNLRTLWAQITPQHRGIVTNLNSAAEEGRCGSRWTLRRPQDVTATGGCRLLGVTVPSTAYEAGAQRARRVRQCAALPGTRRHGRGGLAARPARHILRDAAGAVPHAARAQQRAGPAGRWRSSPPAASPRCRWWCCCRCLLLLPAAAASSRRQGRLTAQRGFRLATHRATDVSRVVAGAEPPGHRCSERTGGADEGVIVALSTEPVQCSES